MKKNLLQTCVFVTLFGLLVITMTGRVSASTAPSLQITDVSGNSVTYTYDQLLAMPQTSVSANLYCYGNLVTGGNWGGVSLSYLLQQAGVDPAVASVDFLALDGYKVSIPLTFAMRADVIIAYEKDGSLLSEGLRLVLPGQNGNMWIAKITGIAMSTVIVDISQPVNIAPRLALPPINSTGQSSTQQQQPVQPQPTATPKNLTSTESVAPPANVTHPTEKASVPQGSSAEGLSFPLVVVYRIALGITVTLVAVGYVAYRRRR